jgi:hypothetical protein
MRDRSKFIEAIDDAKANDSRASMPATSPNRGELRAFSMNDSIQPAAAKPACHRDRPDPPLGCNRWFFIVYTMFSGPRSSQAGQPKAPSDSATPR